MKRSPFEKFPHIVTSDITLREINEADLDRLYEIYSNKNLFHHSPVMIKKNKDTVKNMIGHFDRDFRKGKMIFLGISLNSDPEHIVGVGELFDYDSNVNMITIGYRLHEEFWGKGIATKAVKAMIEYLFHDLEINRIQAFVMPENIKSLNVLRRNQFVEEGTIRQGHVWKGIGVVDLVLFSLLKSEA